MDQDPCGGQSRDCLCRITPIQVSIVIQYRDHYGRLIGELFDGERSFNLALVEAEQRWCTHNIAVSVATRWPTGRPARRGRRLSRAGDAAAAVGEAIEKLISINFSNLNCL